MPQGEGSKGRHLGRKSVLKARGFRTSRSLTGKLREWHFDSGCAGASCGNPDSSRSEFVARHPASIINLAHKGSDFSDRDGENINARKFNVERRAIKLIEIAGAHASTLRLVIR